MKKLFLILFAGILLCSFIPNKEIRPDFDPFKWPQLKVLTYDPDAQALFDTIGDMKVYEMNAINNLFLGIKADGLFDSIKTLFVFQVTQDKFKCLIDAKSRKRVASFNDQAIGAPYYTDNALGVNDGLFFTPNNGTGFVKTGHKANLTMKLNNSCIAFITLKDKTAGNNNLNFGAYQSATQEIGLNVRNSLNVCFADMYSNTNGRVSHTSATGAKGVYIMNRTSLTKMKLMINGSVDSVSTGQGSLPTIEDYFNCQNLNGVAQGRANRSIGAFIDYGQGLTDAQMVSQNAVLQQFRIDMQRHGDYNKLVVFDGDSHSVSQWSKIFRQLQYDHAGMNDSTEYIDVATSSIGMGTGVPPSGTVTILNRAATVVDPLYNASYIKNIDIVWAGTNDLLAGRTAIYTYDSIVKYCQARTAIGWEVICIKPMSRYYNGDTLKISRTDSLVKLLEVNPSSYCTKLMNHPGTHYFVRRASYGTGSMTAYKNSVNTLTSNTIYYFTDKTHKTEYGDAHEWAPQYRLYIDSVINGQ